jgi:hypothetical protein
MLFVGSREWRGVKVIGALANAIATNESERGVEMCR